MPGCRAASGFSRVEDMYVEFPRVVELPRTRFGFSGISVRLSSVCERKIVENLRTFFETFSAEFSSMCVCRILENMTEPLLSSAGNFPSRVGADRRGDLFPPAGFQAGSSGIPHRRPAALISPASRRRRDFSETNHWPFGTYPARAGRCTR